MGPKLTQYLIVFALIAIAAGVALYFRHQANKVRLEEEARRRGFEREARLLERRKKPRPPH